MAFSIQSIFIHLLHFLIICTLPIRFFFFTKKFKLLILSSFTFFSQGELSLVTLVTCKAFIMYSGSFNTEIYNRGSVFSFLTEHAESGYRFTKFETGKWPFATQDNDFLFIFTNQNWCHAWIIQQVGSLTAGETCVLHWTIVCYPPVYSVIFNLDFYISPFILFLVCSFIIMVPLSTCPPFSFLLSLYLSLLFVFLPFLV